MGKHMRPRLSSIEQLPDECDGIVAWAAQELGRRDASLTATYAEFRNRLIALQGELGLAFEIPSFSSFGRHSMRLGNLQARTRRSLDLANAITEDTDGADADALTKATTQTLKVLLLELAEGAGEAGFEPKEAKAMADAVKSLQAAENLSTARRQKLQAEFDAKAEKIIDTVAKEKGMSAETISQLRRDFLGVRAKPKEA